MKKINDYLTTPDLLCQLAEEASELAQAALRQLLSRSPRTEYGKMPRKTMGLILKRLSAGLWRPIWVVASPDGSRRHYRQHPMC